MASVASASEYPCVIFHMVARKNPHAVALGKLGGEKRAEVLSFEEQSEIGRRAGQVGGRARAKKLSSKRRSEIARQAAAARWAKTKPD